MKEDNKFRRIIKNKLQILIFLSISSLFLTSCAKDYITGGKITDVNQFKSFTTYEVLNKLSQCDSLVLLIDAAGLKDEINQQNSTFFAVQNEVIDAYLNYRTTILQATENQFAKFGFDSLVYYVKNNIAGTKDSLLMYLVKNVETTPKNLTLGGQIFPTALAGDSAILSYEITDDPELGYTGIVSNPPRIVYFTQLWKHYNLSEDSTATIVPVTTGSHTRVSTSFINTSNGVINVLNPTSVLFFYGTKSN